MLKRTLVVFAIMVCLLAVIARAYARDAAGNITFIQEPLSTTPQFVQPGGTITVDVAERIYNNCGCAFHLYLMVDKQQFELSGVVRGTDPATSTYRFSATIPAGLETGQYDLIAIKGANKDSAPRAVAVTEEYPTEYSILHIHDPRVSPGGDTGQLLELAAEMAGQNNIAFVVITGAITASSDVEDTTRFFEITDKFPVPTLVADPAGSASLGALPHAFSFEDSAFLLADPLGHAPEQTCAETVLYDLAKQGKVADQDKQAFDKMSDSLFFETDGTGYHVIPNPRDDDCLKATKDTFSTPPLSGGKARLLTFKNSKLTENKLIGIKP